MVKVRMIIISLLMVLGLAACGTNQEDTNVDNNVSNNETEDSITENTKLKLEDFWVIEDEVKVPELPNMEIREVTVKEGKTIQVCKSPFEFDDKEVFSKFKNSNFIKDRYDIGTKYSERAEGFTYEDIGAQKEYSIVSSVIGKRKGFEGGYERYKGLEFDMIRNTTNEDNYCSFTLRLLAFNEYEGFQQGVETVLSDLVGNDLARYMLYQKGSEDGYDLDKTILIGNAEYHIERHVNASEHDLVLSCTMQTGHTGFRYFSDNYISCYDDLKYNLADIFNQEKVGNLNPNTSDSLFNKYLSLGSSPYKFTSLEHMLIEKISIDGQDIYSIDMKATKALEDVSSLVCPKLQIIYRVSEADGVVDDKYLSIESDYDYSVEGELSSKTANYLYDSLKEQLLLAFPDTDVNEIVCNGEEGSETFPITVKFHDGSQYDTKVKFVVRGDAEIRAGEYHLSIGNDFLDD